MSKVLLITILLVFSAVGRASAVIAKLSLIDTTTNKPITGFDPLLNSATIDLASLPTQKISIRATTSPSQVYSVVFHLGTATHTEKSLPYDLCGDTSGAAQPCASLNVPGTYTLTATPYSSSTSAGTSSTIKFSITNSAANSSPTPTPPPATTSSSLSNVGTLNQGGPANCATSGRQFYIANSGSDTNSGSSTSPWKTFAHANSVIQAGDTVHVLAGTYTESIKTTKSGSSAARICWMSETKWAAKIMTKGSSDSWQQRGDYVDVAGFEVTGDGYVGIHNLASNDRIMGNLVHNIPAAGCLSSGGAGIDAGGYSFSPPTHDVDFINNVVHDIGDPTVKCYRVHGFYHAIKGGHVFNNVAFYNQGWGIHLWHAAEDVSVSNNLVFRNGQGGITVGSGDSGMTSTSGSGIAVNNNMVIYNGVWNTSAPAIRENGQVGVNTYANNLIWGNGAGIELLNGNVATGTINANPQLVNYKPDGTGDYHATSLSPAINHGTSYRAPVTDYDGVSRPAGSAYDIGIYEYQ